MSDNRIVYMANQIARAFKPKGEDAAIAETANHIRSFWDPRMRAQLAAHLAEGGAGLDTVAKAAAERVAIKEVQTRALTVEQEP